MKQLLAVSMALVLTSAAWAAEKANPKAVIHTDAGDITIELYSDKAPKTVENFIGLSKGTKQWKNPNTGEAVTGKPLYDNVKFHRTIQGFMIQAGDPAGTGAGDVGFNIPGEPNDLKFNKAGRVAMANRGGNPSSAGSQFFITDSPTPQLDPSPSAVYVIFGQVVDGMDVVKDIAGRPTRGETPVTPVVIKNVEILEPGASAEKKPAGATTSPADKPTTK